MCVCVCVCVFVCVCVCVSLDSNPCTKYIRILVPRIPSQVKQNGVNWYTAMLRLRGYLKKS